MNIKPYSLEEQIIKTIQENYPITVEELKKKLNARDDAIERVLKKLLLNGIIEYDILPDKIYIRMKVIYTKFGKKRKKKSSAERNRFDTMYG